MDPNVARWDGWIRLRVRSRETLRSARADFACSPESALPLEPPEELASGAENAGAGKPGCILTLETEVARDVGLGMKMPPLGMGCRRVWRQQ